MPDSQPLVFVIRLLDPSVCIEKCQYFTPGSLDLPNDTQQPLPTIGKLNFVAIGPRTLVPCDLASLGLQFFDEWLFQLSFALLDLVLFAFVFQFQFLLFLFQRSPKCFHLLIVVALQLIQLFLSLSYTSASCTFLFAQGAKLVFLKERQPCR